jgi:hypothetical protein
MTGQTKHPAKKFERKAGAMPTLKRAASQAAPLNATDTVNTGQTAQASVPGYLSQREVLLRLVETLKSL